MVRLLLDTNVVLRQYADIGPYPARLRAVVASASEVAVSVICFVEIGIKVSTGRLAVPAGIARAEGYAIVTSDRAFRNYDIDVIAA